MSNHSHNNNSNSNMVCRRTDWTGPCSLFPPLPFFSSASSHSFRAPSLVVRTSSEASSSSDAASNGEDMVIKSVRPRFGKSAHQSPPRLLHLASAGVRKGVWYISVLVITTIIDNTSPLCCALPNVLVSITSPARPSEIGFPPIAMKMAHCPQRAPCQ